MAVPGSGSSIANLLFAISRATEFSGQVIQTIHTHGTIGYDYLKKEDIVAHRVGLATVSLVIFYKSRVGSLLFFSAGYIAHGFYRESILTSVQKTEWIWKETKTVPLLLVAAAFAIALRKPWACAALGLGIYLSSPDKPAPQSPPDSVSQPLGDARIEPQFIPAASAHVPANGSADSTSDPVHDHDGEISTQLD